MEQGGAYGAGKAGEQFNAVDFIKRPKTILRFSSWVCIKFTFSQSTESKKFDILFFQFMIRFKITYILRLY